MSLCICHGHNELPTSGAYAVSLCHGNLELASTAQILLPDTPVDDSQLVAVVDDLQHDAEVLRGFLLREGALSVISPQIEAAQPMQLDT
jgi:hypothetical protein